MHAIEGFRKALMSSKPKSTAPQALKRQIVLPLSNTISINRFKCFNDGLKLLVLLKALTRTKEEPVQHALSVSLRRFNTQITHWTYV